MIRAGIRSADVMDELSFTASRSSGPGGQHVNKVSSRITLRWSVRDSAFLTMEEKERLQVRLQSRVTAEGELILMVQESRSQLSNKALALEKLDQLLAEALKPKKVRKRTKPSLASVTKRLESKKRHSEKKKNRRID
jgi:ribosome-associated protein